MNQNNVTRTRAYYQFYKRYPEIHWALLGHMVSRNGGWNMTDLKGIYIRNCYLRKINLLSFLLERGNWLIFQDVYPQFLLYEQSVKKQKSFSSPPSPQCVNIHGNNVELFWKTGNKQILTIATIINEQNYLEKSDSK